MREYVAIVEIEVDFAVSGRARERALSALNMHYVGAPDLALDPTITDAHLDAHRTLTRGRRSALRMGVLADGNLEQVLPDQLPGGA